MEPVSLHPFDPTIAAQFIDVLTGTLPADPAWQAILPANPERELSLAWAGDESASNRISLAFANIVALDHPSFFHDGFGLTTWEARVDRGIGMLMRPPSRLFTEAGLERRQVEAMPIRLELQGGLMSGAWIPPRLIGNLRELLDSRLDRMARRLYEAEYDPFALIGLMYTAADYAAQHNLGLIEAIGVVGPHGEHAKGVRVIGADQRNMNPDILRRIEIAITPPKKPGLVSRLLGKRSAPSNGRLPDESL
jgi:hypothetical protein